MKQIKVLFFILLSTKYAKSLEFCNTNITCSTESNHCCLNDFCCEKNEPGSRLQCFQKCTNNLCCTENFCCVSASLISRIEAAGWNRIIYMLAVFIILCSFVYFFTKSAKKRDDSSHPINNERENQRTVNVSVLRPLPPSYQHSQKIYMNKETTV